MYPDKSRVEERVTKLEEQLAEKNAVVADLTSNGTQKKTELDEMRTKIERLESTQSKMVAEDYFKKTPVPDAVDEALTRNPPDAKTVYIDLV